MAHQRIFTSKQYRAALRAVSAVSILGFLLPYWVSPAPARAEVAPVVVAPASITMNEGGIIMFNVTASDPDGDAITSLTTSPLPPGAEFTVGSTHTRGSLIWSLGFNQAGVYDVTFTATSGVPPLSGSTTTHIVVTDVDRAPVVTAPATTSAIAGRLATFSLFASDPDGNPISSLTAAGMPSGATFTANAGNTIGTFSWTPSVGQLGNYTIVFTASNARSSSSATSVAVTLSDSHAPVFDPIPEINVAAGDSFTQQFTVRDQDFDQMTFQNGWWYTEDIVLNPIVDQLGYFLGEIQWTPGVAYYGETIQLDICARDDIHETCEPMVVHVGSPPNHPPVLAAVPHVPSTVTVRYGETLRLPFAFTDEDNDLMYNICPDPIICLNISHPIGELFGDPDNRARYEDVVSTPGYFSGTLVWTPREVDVTGSLNDPSVEGFCAYDGFDNGCAYLLLTVPEPLPPRAVLSVSPTSVCTGDLVTFDGTGSYDPDGTLTGNEWAFGDGQLATGTGDPASLLVTRAYGSPGTYTPNLTVFDNTGLQATATVPPIVVSDPVNGLPPGLPTNEYLMLIPFDPNEPFQALAEIMIQGFISQNGNFDPANVDTTPENTSLRFTDDFGVVHEIHPAAVIPEPANGRVVFFFFPPDPEQLFATLGHDTTVTLHLEGRLNNVSGCNRIQSDFPFRVIRNHVPSITPVSYRTIYRDETLTFTATATDPDDDPVTFSMDDFYGDFPGAMLDPITGAFTWQPGPDSLGTHGPLELCVVDHHNQGGSPFGCTSFQVTVLNRPPVAVANITTPTPLCVGQPVQFNGSTSYDADGTIVAESWDFGDGTPSTTGNLNVAHTYATAGIYQSTLTVTDNDGAATAAVINAEVTTQGANKTGGTTNLIYSGNNPGDIEIQFLPKKTWLLQDLDLNLASFSLTTTLGSTSITPNHAVISVTNNGTYGLVHFPPNDVATLLAPLPTKKNYQTVKFTLTGKLKVNSGCDTFSLSFNLSVLKK